MSMRRSSIETSTPAKALLKAHYAEQAWEFHHEYDLAATEAGFGPISGVCEKTASMIMAANTVKAARSRANLASRTADLQDWERRLAERERRLIECEDAIENMATMYSRRSVVVMRALRLQWGRETAVWSHHIAGFMLLALILGAVLSIGAHWQVKSWNCSQWQGMACWGVLGFTVIAGLSYLARIWIEERAVDSVQSGAYIFACMMPFVHLLTCLIAALWTVGISTVCHAV